MTKQKVKMDNMVNTLDEEFPSNSKANKMVPIRPTNDIVEEGANVIEEPVKETRKSIKGRAIRRKKSILGTFFGEDFKSVAQYTLFEVLIPAAKNTIQEMVTQGIELFLFGEGSSGRGRSRDRSETRVSYNSMYKRREEGRQSLRGPRRDKFGLDEIFFRKGDEATEVLEQMCEHLEKYEQISVADYYDIAGIDGATWTHAKWGWENLRKAYCTHTRNGYAIVLPEPMELD